MTVGAGPASRIKLYGRTFGRIFSKHALSCLSSLGSPGMIDSPDHALFKK